MGQVRDMAIRTKEALRQRRSLQRLPLFDRESARLWQLPALSGVPCWVCEGLAGAPHAPGSLVARCCLNYWLVDLYFLYYKRFGTNIIFEGSSRLNLMLSSQKQYAFDFS